MVSDTPHHSNPPDRLYLSRNASPAPAGLILLIVVLGLALLGGTIFMLTQKTVTLDIDGQIATIYTHHVTVGEVVQELGLALNQQDAISPAPGDRLGDGTVISVRRAQTVILSVDGQTREWQSLESSPRDILAEAGVTLGRYDLLMADGVLVAAGDQWAASAPPALLEVVRAVSLTIDDDGRIYTLHTTEPTVGEMLYGMGLALYLADDVSPEVSAPVTEGMRVTVRRSTPLVIRVDGTEVHTRTRATSVAVALAGAGLALVGDDYSVPPLEDVLPPDGAVEIVRVSEEVQVERSAIPYQTVYRPDHTMELDARRVIQEGGAGIAERRTRIRLENGVEVSRVEEPERVHTPPVDEVIAYGTKIVTRTLDTPEGPREYWRVIRMLATSYTPGTSSKPIDAPNYGIASTGVRVHKGIVAVDPEVIPYFTRVYVAGYGEGLAADTGGAINGRRIDLGYSDDDLELWYGWVDVYLMTPAPDPEDIMYVLP